jgi:hypothetical protein
VAPLLTLITYLVAAALAAGYACETGLPSWRRATACFLGVILAFGSGWLLISDQPLVAYAVGMPALLALGTIMIAPERKPAPPVTTPHRRASDQARPTGPARPAARWQFDRRAPHRGSVPILTERRGAPHTGAAAGVASAARATQITRAPAVTGVPGDGGVRPRRATDGHLAARRHTRRSAPRSLSRLSRCTHR